MVESGQEGGHFPAVRIQSSRKPSLEINAEIATLAKCCLHLSASQLLVRI